MTSNCTIINNDNFFFVFSHSKKIFFWFIYVGFELLMNPCSSLVSETSNHQKMNNSKFIFVCLVKSFNVNITSEGEV